MFQTQLPSLARLSVLVVLALGLAFAVDAGRATPGDAAGRGASRITWPSPAFRELQDAVDSAADGGVVEIEAGTFQIPAPIMVIGKGLTIRGQGSGQKSGGQITHLIGPAPQPVVDRDGNMLLRADAVDGLLNFIGSDSTVRDVKLSGFDASIVLRDHADGRPAGVNVKHVVIEGTGRGILSRSSGPLHVTGAVFQNTLWHGISISPAAGIGAAADFIVAESVFGGGGGAGIFFENTIGVVSQAPAVKGYLGGGIVGSNSFVIVDSTKVFDNSLAAILLVNSQAIIDNTLAASTFPALNGQFGDGMVFVLSGTAATDAVVKNSFIHNNWRAGVSNFGSFVSLEGNQFASCLGFCLNEETYLGNAPNFVNLGSNTCEGGACVLVSAGLAPPLPVPDP